LGGCHIAPLKNLGQPAPKIGLALGSGAAHGFAHIGVLKALEAQGIHPDFIAGTSAGSVVGAIYASGHAPLEVQRMALEMDESQIADWGLPSRGFLKGEALAAYVNRVVSNRPLEKLKIPLAVVATDLKTGTMKVFRNGNAGQAVRASSAVPTIFRPVEIQGGEYVDGGLVSPVPAGVARDMGATFVIAVDIGDKPTDNKVSSALDVFWQTWAIMGRSLARHDLKHADIVVRPNLVDVSATDFKGKNRAILEGEAAVARVLPELRSKLQAAGWRPRERIAQR
ncbi:MAG: patatin-like phospholipase family protein, partial [Rhodocyclaceae bacterium]